ncbi:MAG: WGR domain-containing protein [Pirellulales bacterium]|nr:WGR domain-containing protein [Pirellulales bacterium]
MIPGLRILLGRNVQAQSIRAARAVAKKRRSQRVDRRDANILQQIQVLGKLAPDRAAKKRPAGRAIAEETSKRYFELVADKSRKFWEVAVDGKKVTVRFGRIGAQGQTRVKTFETPAAASAHAQRLIGQKTGKGYQEQSPAE